MCIAVIDCFIVSNTTLQCSHSLQKFLYGVVCLEIIFELTARRYDKVE